MMKLRQRQHALLIVLASLALGLTAGCGKTARVAFKEGVYTFVNSSFSNSLISAQLGDFVTDVFTGGFIGDE